MNRKIARAFLEIIRYLSTVMALMAIVNMVLIITGSRYIIYFSALLPQFLTTRGFDIALKSGYAPLETFAIILGAIFILLLILSALFSYKKRGWFIVAASLIAADLSVAIYMIVGENNLSFIPDLIINGCVALTTFVGFFGSGAVCPKAKEAIDDEAEFVYEAGYSEEFVPAATIAVSRRESVEKAPLVTSEFEGYCVEEIESVEDEKPAEAPVAAVEPQKKSSDAEIEDGVILKITFRVPTFNRLKKIVNAFVDDED